MKQNSGPEPAFTGADTISQPALQSWTCRAGAVPSNYVVALPVPCTCPAPSAHLDHQVLIIPLVLAFAAVAIGTVYVIVA